MKRLWVLALLIPLAGCPSFLAQAPTTLQGLYGQIDQIIPQLEMQKAADVHNLLVGLQAIQAAPGMVTMVPVVGSTTPIVVSAPATPVGPPTVPSPNLPTGPTPNG